MKLLFSRLHSNNLCKRTRDYNKHLSLPCPSPLLLPLSHPPTATPYPMPSFRHVKPLLLYRTLLQVRRLRMIFNRGSIEGRTRGGQESPAETLNGTERLIDQYRLGPFEDSSMWGRDRLVCIAIWKGIWFTVAGIRTPWNIFHHTKGIFISTNNY